MAPHVASFAPTLLWSSDLARARQTAAYVEKETGLVARLDARLREFDVGERTGLTFDEAAIRFPAQHAELLAGRLGPVPGAETAGGRPRADDAGVRRAACRARSR